MKPQTLFMEERMNKKMILPALAALSMSGFQAQAAQGTAQAKMKVTTAIAVTKVSDLIFAEAAAGAAAETVPADTVETAQNASFTVTGEPSKAVTVTLPNDGTITMVTAGGATADEQIPVNQFTSNGLSSIDPSGTSELFVGATRENLTANQVAGDYVADFLVDVVYQ